MPAHAFCGEDELSLRFSFNSIRYKASTKQTQRKHRMRTTLDQERPGGMSMMDASTGARYFEKEEPAAATIDVSLHLHGSLEFAESELERLYGNIYASMKEWRVTGELGNDVSAYVEIKGGVVTTLYLFRVRGREVRVLNEGIRVDNTEADRFAETIFAACPGIGVITFHAVRSTMRELRYPCHRYACLEDIVLKLPASADAYLAGMGSATRSYIKRYLNKARRSLPSFQHDVTFGADIDVQELREVIAFNKLRMEGKGKEQGIDERELHRILALAKECGMLCVVRIDGKIRAGTINFRVGDNYFLEVIAHDPAYNEFRLGTLCCYLTICECIARNGREYHFLWGPQEYKFRLQGVQEELAHLTIYRSRRHALLCAATVIQNLRREWSRKGKAWLRQAREGESGTGRLLSRMIGMLRR